MSARKLHDEALLRSKTRALAKLLYEKRWGRLTDADAVTLDVERWQASWEIGREVERQAQRHLAEITKTLKNAAAFVSRVRTAPREPDGKSPPFPATGLPMGQAAQVLEDCVPVLFRTLQVIASKREIALIINPAVRPTRPTWISQRLLVYYQAENELADAPREELGALGILAGWWPPKATGFAVTSKGMAPEHVLALESDLMARARDALEKRRSETEQDPMARKLMSILSAALLDVRETGKLSPPGESVRSGQAHAAPQDDVDSEPQVASRQRSPRRGPPHRGKRGL